MKQDGQQTQAALGRMTPAQLRAQYLEVFGEPSRSGNKGFRAKRIAWRVQSLAEGGLSERAKAPGGGTGSGFRHPPDHPPKIPIPRLTRRRGP